MGHSPHILAQATASAGFQSPIVTQRLLGSDDSQQIFQITLDDGTRLVAKVIANGADHNGSIRLQTEAAGLAALAQSGHLLIPSVHTQLETEGQSVVLMEALAPAPSHSNKDEAWDRFGRSLAAHHLSGCERRYGWDRDNFIGPTPQPNDWCDDWIEFTAVHRLGHQATLCRQRGLLADREQDTLARVIDRLSDWLPRTPRPALLHGDLWAGNPITTQRHIQGRSKTEIALIDPAPSVGDAWADIAMMRLFGGFPDACFRAYSAAMDDHKHIEQRILVYQLYHMLDHLNIFGITYKHSPLHIANTLLG